MLIIYVVVTSVLVDDGQWCLVIFVVGHIRCNAHHGVDSFLSVELWPVKLWFIKLCLDNDRQPQGIYWLVGQEGRERLRQDDFRWALDGPADNEIDIQCLEVVGPYRVSVYMHIPQVAMESLGSVNANARCRQCRARNQRCQLRPRCGFHAGRCTQSQGKRFAFGLGQHLAVALKRKQYRAVQIEAGGVAGVDHVTLRQGGGNQQADGGDAQQSALSLSMRGEFVRA